MYESNQMHNLYPEYRLHFFNHKIVRLCCSHSHVPLETIKWVILSSWITFFPFHYPWNIIRWTVYISCWWWAVLYSSFPLWTRSCEKGFNPTRCGRTLVHSDLIHRGAKQKQTNRIFLGKQKSSSVYWGTTIQ